MAYLYRADDESPRREWGRKTPQWLGLGGFLASVAFLAFLAGAYVVFDKTPPYPLLKSTYSAGKALHAQLTEFTDPLKSNLWVKARTNARGVTTYDPAKAYPGFTLYASGHNSAAYLIDMNGHVVHEWHLPFSKVWDETSVVAKPRPDPFIYFDKAYLFPNGDLLAIYNGFGDTPWGLGLVKMDKDSRVIWKFLERVHHDVEVGEDGRIYTLTHAMRHKRVVGLEHLEPPLIEDFLVILSPDGKVERKISLLEAVVNSPYRRFLHQLPAYAQDDPLHANAVEPIGTKGAENFPFAKADDVLLNFRQSGLIAVFDPEEGRFVWGTRGPWIGQHDPDLLPNGNILLFDNNGDVNPGGNSRVIEFDPKTHKIVWSYAGTSNRPFDSPIRSSQERLPNGNTLITESDGGRLFEVTHEGEIVWEYVNPIRGGEGDGRIPIVAWGQRYSSSALEAGFPGP